MTVAWLLAGALLVADGTMTEQIRFTTLGSGSQSSIEEPRQVVVRTAAEWKTLWQSHAPGEPLPPVDFSTATVIGVFSGFRNTGGHTVEITAIAREGERLVVTWQESRPPRDAIVTQVLTFPFHLVQIPQQAPRIVVFQQKKP
jgi:hypothetical protein